MAKRSVNRKYSTYIMDKVWADNKTIKLIKAMRLLPVLRRAFNRYSIKKAEMEKLHLEKLLDCPIMEIGRKWKTLRAYYNKLSVSTEDKQNQWRFYTEMSITMALDPSYADTSEPHSDQRRSKVCFTTTVIISFNRFCVKFEHLLAFNINMKNGYQI